MGTSTSLTLGGLFLFGVIYNLFVAWLERRGYDQGYTALLVVVGTAVTLIGVAVLAGVQSMLWALVCFAASGLPMVVGSIARHVCARASDEEKARELARGMMPE